MDNEIAVHNEICLKFKDFEYSKKFIAKYVQNGCKKIKKITLEDIISNNNVLIGFCDVIIDYDDEDENEQKLLIEVKSSASVINKDPMEVLRQIKKYRFYNKEITKVFLIYPGPGYQSQTVTAEDLFTDEGITVFDIERFHDDLYRDSHHGEKPDF